MTVLKRKIQALWAEPGSGTAWDLGRGEEGCWYIARVIASKKGWSRPPAVQSGPYDFEEDANDVLREMKS